MSDLTLTPGFGSYQDLHYDAFWIQSCMNGEESAFLKVYNQYAGSIYRLCYGMLQHREDSEGVLQDSFEYVFRRLKKYDGSRASFKT